MTRGSAWMLLGLTLSIFTGCGPPRVTSTGNTLIGAKFDIPVYPGARIVTSGSPTTFHRGDPSAPTTYDGVVWKLSFSDPADKVVAFYDSRLRDARRLTSEMSSTDPPADANSDLESAPIAAFRYTPQGAAVDEEVTIEIYDGRIEIAQVARQE